MALCNLAILIDLCFIKREVSYFRDTFNHNNSKVDAAGFTLADYLLKSKTANNFESIAAGTNRNTAKIMIQQLIIDKGIPSLGHRKHLLGMTYFWADAEYCGIGFYKKPGSTYTYYMCVLIAKHE